MHVRGACVSANGDDECRAKSKNLTQKCGEIDCDPDKGNDIFAHNSTACGHQKVWQNAACPKPPHAVLRQLGLLLPTPNHHRDH